MRSAGQNSRLSLSRTQAGWLLIGGVMTLGNYYYLLLIMSGVIINSGCMHEVASSNPDLAKYNLTRINLLDGGRKENLCVQTQMSPLKLNFNRLLPW